MSLADYRDLPDATILDGLRRAAAEAAARAYAPYSHFHVGAALLFDDGATVTGCNVENISWGLTSCAERNALFRAVSESGPARRIVAVAVAGGSGGPCSPCGACRQVLSEFVTADAVITFPGEGGPVTLPFAEIYPFAFRFSRGAQ